jgi:hypothetical protein
MSYDLIYWVMMLIWVLFFLAWNFGGAFAGPYGPAGNGLFLFILFLLIGIKVFGPPIHG